MKTKELANSLRTWLSENERLLLLPNVFLGGSPWESDMIAVTPSYYWTEYEIKVSVNDYRRDFNKRMSNKFRQKHLEPWPKKHDLYSSDAAIDKTKFYRGKPKCPIIPKPKYFYFVTPTGLLKDEELPDHCGLIEIGEGIGVSKYAPHLRNATKLDQYAIFTLAVKAANRIGR